MEEERQAKIDHDNEIMLDKMTAIATRKGALDNKNDYQQHSLHR